MHVGSPRILAGLALVAVAAWLAPPSAARPAQASKDTKGADLSEFLDLGAYYVKPVRPKKDPKTGFIVGGKNETALIRTLKEINGRSIADLEKDMRPGAKSKSGFLGEDEKLLDVLAADNKYVVDEKGLTHQELAKHLHAMGSIAYWQSERKKSEAEF